MAKYLAIIIAYLCGRIVGILQDRGYTKTSYAVAFVCGVIAAILI